MKKYILSIDQGTTGTTALIVEKESLEIIAKFNEEFKQIFPKPGQVEHNLNDIWNTVKSTTKKVIELANIDPQNICSIGITNQRETTCAYNNAGLPLANAIVWQDRRTSDYCDSNRNRYKDLQNKTGLPLDPYFSGTKMNWLLKNNSNVKEAVEINDLKLSTIDTYILYKLSNCKSFKTEPSNASRTLLMDLETCNWDNELLEFFNIKSDYLPKIVDSFSEFGVTEGLSFLPDGIPISCILGDQQAALFGQAGINKGDLKCTYGTGAFILLNTGREKVFSSSGLLTTVAFKHDNKPVYALEGSSYIAGAAVQWLRDNLNIIDSAPDVENLAKQVTNMEEMEFLQFLPFFTGIGSPYWNAQAKGAIVGLTRDTQKKHIARACLEGIALSVNDSISALTKDVDTNVSAIRVDGGACLNDLLMQFQSNFSNIKVIRPKIIETTAYGVALGSLIGVNDISFDQLKEFIPESDSYFKHKNDMWKSYINKNF
jgi:glycerol kinase